MSIKNHFLATAIRMPVVLLATVLTLSANNSNADALPQAINPDLSIHKNKKLHPEFSDPVLGDRAAIVEWAWSPQYAKRFKQPVQADGLKDGALWLIGIKITRQQYQNYQRYTCNILGLIDNKLPILTPPGDIYTITPGRSWQGGMPGFRRVQPIVEFTPGQAAWIKQPSNALEKERPHSGLTLSYLQYYRNVQPGLAFFEIEGACGYFEDPAIYRNEIRFPTHIDGKNDSDRQVEAVFEPSALIFDIPDSLMRRIYPYLLDANDWTSCMARRAGDKSNILTLRALRTKRFGNTCEPVSSSR